MAPPGVGGVEAAAAAAPVGVSVRESLLDWGHGDCHLRLSSSGHGRLPVRCPMVSAHLNLQIDGYLEDGRQLSSESISVPVHLSPASRVATLRGAKEAVICDVVLECHGEVPDEALGFLAEALSHYICDVAVARARAEAGPFLTEVSADAHVRVLLDEDDDDDLDWEVEDDSELQPSLSTTETVAAMDGRVASGSGKEGERCAICLEKMAAAGGRGTQWLPCSHSFHEACVGRWLRQKGQCPLCRLPVLRPR